MFSDVEITKLQKLIDPELKPSDFFDKEELLAFQASLSLISENLFIPKHARAVKTLRLKKFFSPQFDLTETTRQILKCLSQPVQIRIGVSFLVHCGPMAETIKYYFAIAQRPLNPDQIFIEDAKSGKNLLDFLSKFNRNDILANAFEQVNEDNVFEKSDFRPRDLVLATFWITRTAED